MTSTSSCNFTKSEWESYLSGLEDQLKRNRRISIKYMRSERFQNEILSQWTVGGGGTLWKSPYVITDDIQSPGMVFAHREETAELTHEFGGALDDFLNGLEVI